MENKRAQSRQRKRVEATWKSSRTSSQNSSDTSENLSEEPMSETENFENYGQESQSLRLVTLLKKVRDQGPQSLTPEEIQFLQQSQSQSQSPGQSTGGSGKSGATGKPRVINPLNAIKDEKLRARAKAVKTDLEAGLVGLFGPTYAGALLAGRDGVARDIEVFLKHTDSLTTRLASVGAQFPVFMEWLEKAARYGNVFGLLGEVAIMGAELAANHGRSIPGADLFGVSGGHAATLDAGASHSNHRAN